MNFRDIDHNTTATHIPQDPLTFQRNLMKKRNTWNVRQLDSRGRNLAHYAASIGYNIILTSYLEDPKGHPIDLQDVDGNTMLHLAVKDGRIDTIKLLLKVHIFSSFFLPSPLMYIYVCITSMEQIYV